MKSIGTLKQSRGAVAPLVAIMLVLIVVCVALVVDLGHIHNVKIELQKAVDAAALAGAQQLTGSVNHVTNAKNVAIATAMVNGVMETEITFIDDPACTTSATESCLGRWDKNALASAASTRFTQTETFPDAILVRVTRNVPHVFFFFVPGTGVTADAIAVALPIKPTLPVAVTTCITSDEVLLPPGTTICDIAPFTFGSAVSDTAGWTSLTIQNANSNNLDLFFTGDGQTLFNKIVYGTGETHDGIENTTVKKAGCTTDDNLIVVKDFDNLYAEPTNITCGLGEEFSETTQNPPDPLLFNPLPRWYDEDAIERTYSMDGILLNNGETASDFETRMNDLKNASSISDFSAYNIKYPDIPVPDEMQDSRFDRYLVGPTNKPKPDYIKPLQEAGYPEVFLIEGVTVTLSKFAESITSGDIFKTMLQDSNSPFDDASSGGEGNTVLLTIPIIFTGECSDAKFNKPGVYVGLANLLLTRMWDTANPKCFDNGANSVTVSMSCPPPPGTDGKFGSNKNKYQLPSLGGLGGDQLVCTENFWNKAFEGLVKLPSHDEEDSAGKLMVYLVE